MATKIHFEKINAIDASQRTVLSLRKYTYAKPLDVLFVLIINAERNKILLGASNVCTLVVSL